jgi:hypothetical protein
MSTLYLTPEETTLYAALPAEVRGAWDNAVVDESTPFDESEEAISARLDHPPYEHDPDFVAYQQKMTAAMQKDDWTDQSMLDAFPARLLPQFFEVIGPCGLCALIELALQNKDFTSAMLGGIAHLSTIRHQMITSKTYSA